MSVFKRGTGKLEMTDAERIERLYSKVVKLQAENAKLQVFVDRCESLTGSLWPQNETTVELADAINKMDYDDAVSYHFPGENVDIDNNN